MGRRGPKPEPAAIKDAKGNPGNRPVGRDPEILSASIGGVAPPPWLQNEALMQWNRLAPLAEQLKLLTRIDAEAFARYCRNFARWLKLQKDIDEAGEYYTVTIDGKEVTRDVFRTHPASSLSIQLERLLESAEAKFGLNPSDRQRIYAARATVGEGDLFAKPAPVNGSSETADPATPTKLIGFLH